MQSQHGLYLLIGICIIVITCGEVWAEVEYLQRHSAWSSGIGTSKDGTEFQAVVKYGVGPDGFIGLMFKRSPDNCLTQSISIVSDNVGPLPTSTGVTPPILGGFRVDDKPSHKAIYTIMTAEGLRTRVLTMTNIENETTLFSELRRGSEVRFAFHIEDGNFPVPFPLSGFTAATTRTLQLCQQFNKNPVKK